MPCFIFYFPKPNMRVSEKYFLNAASIGEGFTCRRLVIRLWLRSTDVSCRAWLNQPKMSSLGSVCDLSSQTWRQVTNRTRRRWRREGICGIFLNTTGAMDTESSNKSKQKQNMFCIVGGVCDSLSLHVCHIVLDDAVHVGPRHNSPPPPLPRGVGRCELLGWGEDR